MEELKKEIDGSTITLAHFPLDVQNYIASYIEEPEKTSFKKYLHSSIPSSKECQYLSETECLRVSENKNLELHTKNKFKIINKKDNLLESTELFGLSPNKKRIVALSSKGISVISLGPTLEGGIYHRAARPINSYFNSKEGRMEAPTKKEQIDATMRGYIEMPWDINLKIYTKPIKLITVSNDGSLVAFANDHQVFLMTNFPNWQYASPEYKKIYEEPLKYIGSDRVVSDLDEFKSGGIRNIAFNRQGSKIGIEHNPYYESLSNQDQVTDENEDDMNRPIILDLHYKYHWVLEKYKQEIAQKKKKSYTKEQILQGKQAVSETMIKERLHLIPSKKVTIIPLPLKQIKKEKPWTLAELFYRLGVCKEWNKKLKNISSVKKAES